MTSSKFSTVSTATPSSLVTSAPMAREATASRYATLFILLLCVDRKTCRWKLRPASTCCHWLARHVGRALLQGLRLAGTEMVSNVIGWIYRYSVRWLGETRYVSASHLRRDLRCHWNRLWSVIIVYLCICQCISVFVSFRRNWQVLSRPGKNSFPPVTINPFSLSLLPSTYILKLMRSLSSEYYDRFLLSFHVILSEAQEF